MKNYQSEILKLNKTVSNINFCCGDYSALLNTVIRQYIPFGKIAFIALESSHFKYSKNVLASLTNAGSKLISLVLKNVPENRVEDFSRVFNLPEDVRAVITFDRKLCALCSYYAAIKEVPLIYIPNSVCVNNCLDSLLFIKNGDISEQISLKRKVFVIVDFNLIEQCEDQACAYAGIISKTSAMVDYRLFCALNKKPVNGKAMAVIQKSISRAFNVFSIKPKNRKKELFVCGLSAELANEAACGEINARDSSEIIAEAIRDRNGDFFGTKLYACLKLLSVYAAVFELKEPLCTVPKLLKSVFTSANAFNQSLNEMVKELNGNAFFIKNNLRFAIKTAQSMQKTVKETLDVEKGIKSTYAALNGAAGVFETDSKAFWNTFKLVSCLPRSQNGCAYAALMGVLDLNIDC